MSVEGKAIQRLHQEIADAHAIYYVKKDDRTKVRKATMKCKTRQGRHNEVRAFEKKLEEDKDVVAILNAFASYEWVERMVGKMKKKKLPLTKNAALEHWKWLWEKERDSKKTYY